MSTTSPVTKAGAATGNWLDERLGASKVVKEFSRKVFPDHWSFMLGEIALYSFIILLLSGTFLTFFFIPSSSESSTTAPTPRWPGSTCPRRSTRPCASPSRCAVVC